MMFDSPSLLFRWQLHQPIFIYIINIYQPPYPPFLSLRIKITDNRYNFYLIGKFLIRMTSSHQILNILSFLKEKKINYNTLS